jgi:K+-sensing histidine kinase KdpD
MKSSPAATILIFLSLPICFLAGFVWGAAKDRGAETDLLLERQQDHLAMAESLSEFLRQSEEARRMSSIAIREMKHPLTSIVGYTLTLHEYWDRVDEASRRQFIDYIKVSASRLEAIANDLLRITEFARLTPRVEKEELNLGEIIEEVRLTLEEIYRERKLKIGVRLPQDLPLLTSDSSRLFDLFYNLLDICLRCTNDSQIVSLWGTFKASEVQIRFRSTQSNIPGEKILKLREWPPPEGEGEFETLGMEYRLAQHLVTEVGGKIRLDAVGKMGISVLISLPVE